MPRLEDLGPVYFSDAPRAPLRYIDVVPRGTGGRIDRLGVDADGQFYAGVTFPDGHVEVHPVVGLAGGDTT